MIHLWRSDKTKKKDLGLLGAGGEVLEVNRWEKLMEDKGYLSHCHSYSSGAVSGL